MAIRLRTVQGTRVALCAAKTKPLPEDLYIDDSDHYALAAKFSQDRVISGVVGIVEYPEEWKIMNDIESQDLY